MCAYDGLCAYSLVSLNGHFRLICQYANCILILGVWGRVTIMYQTCTGVTPKMDDLTLIVRMIFYDSFMCLGWVTVMYETCVHTWRSKWTLCKYDTF